MIKKQAIWLRVDEDLKRVTIRQWDGLELKPGETLVVIEEEE